MEWYYARNGQKDGPHAEEAFQKLVESWVVRPDTLVWREGMSEWQPMSQVYTPPPPPVPTPPPTLRQGEAVCAECGAIFAKEELVRIHDLLLCAKCKPAALQKLQEGSLVNSNRQRLERLLKIAKAQRGLNITVAISLVCYALYFAGIASQVSILLISGFGFLVLLPFQAMYVYRLAAALEAGPPVLWLLGVVLLSCIGLILLLVMSSKATSALRAAGFKVGLLGANPKDVERALQGM